MRRRDFITAFAGAAVGPIGARAQPSKRVARIGFLVTGSLESPETRTTLNAFYQGLREYGYANGENVIVEVRAADPGGNTTGLTFLGPQLVPKRLALLKEALPAAYGVAALWHPGAYGVRTMDDMMNEAEGAAQTLGLQLRLFGVREPDELDKAFSAIADERADALIVFPSPMLFAERKRVVDLATKLRLPLISMGKEFVQLGGLMSYGADITDLFRLSGAYVDKVLKGAKPADLPVEQPTKFELSINLKTAKELGIKIPATLLARADEVIE
jgi:putative ABC transport system substrate-binding protein